MSDFDDLAAALGGFQCTCCGTYFEGEPTIERPNAAAPGLTEYLCAGCVLHCGGLVLVTDGTRTVALRPATHRRVTPNLPKEGS